VSAPLIRAMRGDDAPTVASLATQLGYPSSAAQLAKRIAQVLGRDDAAAMIAEDAESVVGWIHVELRRTLVADQGAQVLGLIVDERCRGRGIGAALMVEAERWARERGASTLRVGSRTSRKEAHRFYQREGYRLAKTSNWFEKELA
jgi:ribosomal protein S18 acetylase RimI-like enzyme